MIYKRGRTYWVQIKHDGLRIRESVPKAMGENTLKAARALEKQRLGELANSSFVGADARCLRLTDLRALIDADYVDKERKSADRLDRAWKHLTAFFPGNPRATTITTNQLHQYVACRRAEGAAPATIRNELTGLRRAFRVAVEGQVFHAVPIFPSLRVQNARDVFYSDAEVAAVRNELPPELRNLWTVAAWTGWRRNELFGLQWRQVDLAAGVVRLDVGSTKNGAGREVPFDSVPALMDAFTAQRDYTRVIERRLGRLVPYVFHRAGKPIRRMDVARQRACERAKVFAPDGRPKTLHDMRRTAARALTRARGPRHVAMRILGLKTESMWRRYRIIETDDLRDGLAKVLAFRTREARKA